MPPNKSSRSNPGIKSVETIPGPPPSEQEAEKDVAPPEVPNLLPPLIITNTRHRIEPEFIQQKEISKLKDKKQQKFVSALMWLGTEKKLEPIPKHPISITWWPKELCFRIDRKPVTHKLSISNRSPKIMYIHCCGLWNDMARLGASWRCYPRTRILLAPGLVAEMYIRAKPRAESPVEQACAGLQLATAHRHDTVVGYFVVPIGVIFHNYVAPIIECESENVCYDKRSDVDTVFRYDDDDAKFTHLRKNRYSTLKIALHLRLIHK